MNGYVGVDRFDVSVTIINETAMEKVLGMYWKVDEDILNLFNKKNCQQNERC